MDMLLVLPLLIPLITAVLMLLAWQRTQVQRWLDVAGEDPDSWLRAARNHWQWYSGDRPHW